MACLQLGDITSPDYQHQQYCRDARPTSARRQAGGHQSTQGTVCHHLWLCSHSVSHRRRPHKSNWHCTQLRTPGRSFSRCAQSCQAPSYPAAPRNHHCTETPPSAGSPARTCHCSTVPCPRARTHQGTCKLGWHQCSRSNQRACSNRTCYTPRIAQSDESLFQTRASSQGFPYH